MLDATGLAGAGAEAGGATLSAFAQAVLTQSINCSGVAGLGCAISNMFCICLCIVLEGFGAMSRGGGPWGRG